jgi:hypothetical protein
MRLRGPATPLAAASLKHSRTNPMKTHFCARALVAAVAAVVMASAAPTRADVNDYEFQLVQPTVRVGPETIISVRLVNKKTGRTVPDAVIFATRLDMAPDAMAEMISKMTPVPGGEVGVYRFKANVSMAGRWQLSLGAKVQGETGTVESKLVIGAEK